ncbi:hypothetical protein AMJ85_11765 [candidate division BRC1 bacterium SM23_51]|nr:MAG: hypothetical protein AMJ85_11765 [candidate division BRC1 bacterium SM23_51]
MVFGVAFAIRAVFLFQSLETPYFGAPFLDEKYFYEWAKRISHGQLSYEQAFFRAPLYAYTLGGLFAIAGPNFFLPKLLQHLLGSVAAVLIFKIAERCFDRRTAWVAGLLAALYPPLIFFEGEMLDISLQCFFYPALILIGLRSLSDPRWRWTMLFGLVAGTAAIARPNILLLVACWLVLQVVLGARWGGWRAPHGGFARAGAIVALVVLWMMPPLIHNVRADGSWVPISTYAGVNLYIGNREMADGYTASTPRPYEFFGDYQDSVELFARREAEIAVGQPLTGSEIQRFWLWRTWETITGRLSHCIGLLLKKIVLFWNGYEIRNNKDVYFALKFTPALDWLHRVWNFRVLAPLGLLGIALAALRRPAAQRVENLWLALGVAAHMVSVVLFFVCDRYRLPVTPLLIVFAAGALTTIWQWANEGDFRQAGFAAVGLACLAFLTNLPWFDMSPAVAHKDVWNVANCYKEKGQLDEALRWYERFVQLNADFADGWNNLGEVYVRKNRIEDALACFERAARLDQRVSLPWNNVGFCRLKLGDPEGALSAYEEAIKRAPNNRIARNGRAEALAALGREKEALAELDSLLVDDPDFVLALWTKAAILARRGDIAEASDLLNRALELAPPDTAAEIRADPALTQVLPAETKEKQR